ncbi:polysaccharide pyruvyl transferase family protein [Gottschalkiaceae bacterium SANA]|nr:polysaccharide pyruvyl transferase family protein [Gottschalkiaceae bacterium SANA]
MKVGIITFYNNSVNYGGVLQAYALCKAIQNMGYDCEQISYENSISRILNRGNFLMRTIRSVLYYSRQTLNRKMFKKRHKAIAEFRNMIPHSSVVYDENNIKECTDMYDIFITGSDQVWNLDSFQPAFFLDFVLGKKKIAYAVSLGKKQLTTEELGLFKRKIEDFNYISVRENDAVELLAKATSKPIFCTLDPTLLLEREEWDNVSSVRLVEESYVFCHFIGDDGELRKISREYARKYKKKLVTLPHPSRINKSDLLFGDIQMKDANPGDFISLIKYADTVFTDSFHCCAFSSIYEKQFFAFHRLGKNGMGSRIHSLTSMFNAPNHFCSSADRRKLEYIESVEDINYAKYSDEFNNLKAHSFDYLSSCIATEKRNISFID